MGDSSCQCYPAVRDGYEYDRFISNFFGECLYSPREVASFYVGMSSLLFWMACQAPQFYKNYKHKSGHALSKWFLLEWFMGDALNLTGCLMTRQLTTQIATSTLFVCMDMAMITQLVYYTRCYGSASGALHGSRVKRHSTAQSYQNDAALRTLEEEEEEQAQALLYDTDRQTSTTSSSARSLAALAVPTLILIGAGTTGHGEAWEESRRDLSDLTLIPNCEPEVTVSAFRTSVGTIIGWVSAIVYLNSRIPQLLKNYKRQSVHGLSWIMFFCAVMGNTTYGLGVLLKDASPEALNKAFPWLVGSLGTLFLDFFIIIQFCIYPSHRSASMDAGEYQPLQDTNSESSTVPGGLYGINAWTNSPFFKPSVPDFDIPVRNNTSLGVLPSQIPPSMISSTSAQSAETSRQWPRADSF